jgi:hypothetical protein
VVDITPPGGSSWWAETELAPQSSSGSIDDTIRSIRLLFAKSYGWWRWNDADKQYERVTSANRQWNVPGSSGSGYSAAPQCSGNQRPNLNTWCYVLPTVDDILVNNQTNQQVVERTGVVQLTFTSEVDDNQEPLTGYFVDWGDGTVTSVSGMEMRDRPRAESPHSLYHLYDYNEVVVNNDDCNKGYECLVTPQIWVRDNWGWYSNGTAYDTPPTAPNSGPKILVTNVTAELLPSPPQNTPPTVNSVTYIIVSGQMVQLTANGANDADGDTLYYSWNFGDGQTSNGNSTSPVTTHTYPRSPSQQVYTATVIIIDGNGGSVAASTNVTIAADPITSCQQTSVAYDGNMGGLTGANTLCSNEFGAGWRVPTFPAVRAADDFNDYTALAWANSRSSECETCYSCNLFEDNRSNVKGNAFAPPGGDIYEDATACSVALPLWCCSTQ